MEAKGKAMQLNEIFLYLRWLPIILTIMDFCSSWWIIEIKGGNEIWPSSKWCFKAKLKIDRFLNLACWLGLMRIVLYWEVVFLYFIIGSLIWFIAICICILLNLMPVIYNARSILRILFRSP